MMNISPGKHCPICGHFKTMGEAENRHHYCFCDGNANIIDHFYINSTHQFCESYVRRNSATKVFTPVFGQWYDAEKHIPPRTYYLNECGSREYIPYLVTYLSYFDKVTPCCDTLAIYRDGEWFWAEGEEDVAVKITHWMPLPEPAKGGTDNG